MRTTGTSRFEPLHTEHLNRVRFRQLLARALRLRCPACGQGRLFRGWFHMHERCPRCGLQFEREQGYFVGSIYINYGVCALIVTVIYLVLALGTDLSGIWLFGPLLLFTLIFPLFFHRFARSLWLSFDHFIDPARKRRS